MAFVEGMLIRIKNRALSNFKSLPGDRFGDFLKYFDQLFFKIKIGKIYKRKKMLNYILYSHTKFPNTETNNKEFRNFIKFHFSLNKVFFF